MKVEQQKWFFLTSLSIIWGSSFILIKKALDHFNPYEVGALRVLISGIVLLPIAIYNIKKFPKKLTIWLIIAGLSGNFIPMFLFPIAETEISSSIAGIINSIMPICVIIVGSLIWKFSTTKKQVISISISFVGACLLTFGSGESVDIKLFPMFLLILAMFLYAICTTTIKAKLQDVPAMLMAAYIFSFILLLPSLVALVYSGFFDDLTLDRNTLEGLGIVSVLSIIGTGLAMMMNFKLLSISSPLFASTVTLLMPIVAIFWGVLDGEKLSILQCIGTLIILGGLIFLRGKHKSTS